jgi:uncharacterized protein (TIGR02302 family)
VIDLETLVARRQAMAWLALLWERLWPAAWPAVGVVTGFVALALMGLPPALGGWWHLALLVAAAAAFVVAINFAVRRFEAPSRQEARRRLERKSGLAHRPLVVLEDKLSPTADQGTRALWRAHVEAMRRAVRRLRIGWPRPGLDDRDVYATRAVVFLALIVGLTVGAGEAGQRLANALVPDFSGPPPVPARVDAWINPPAYTGRPPMQLRAAAEAPYQVPEGSTLLARVYGGRGRPLAHLDATQTAFESVDALNHELSLKIDAGERLSVVQEDRTLADWAIEVVPDTLPEIALAQPPMPSQRGTLRLDYKASDDYGLAAARAEFRLADGDGDEVLVRPLTLPAPGIREVAEASFHDLAPHPWAGLEVVLRLGAKDVIGQEGWSADLRFTLPERLFRHPVARAIIEQRKNLVRDPERRGIVALALSAITAQPDSYDHDIVVYLGLRLASTRLRFDRRDAAMPELLDLLWDLALRIEDGRLSLAERELREIQQELMEALARDADDAEIERLMDKLQEAMQRYLKALAEEAQRQMEAGKEPMPFDPRAQSIEAEQLQQMLERARELSRLGARDAAREMLQQLQAMLENLRSGPMMSMPPQLRGTERAMRNLGDLMRDQQRLLDKTFREAQRGMRPGEGKGERQRGRAPARGLDGMSADQEAMRRRLGEIMRQLGEQMGEIPGSLGRAERAMHDARESLGQGQPGPATESQGRAIDQMAEGLRGLAQEMARRLGQGQGDRQLPGNPMDEDPLGRPAAQGGLDTSAVELPGKADLQRAREILDELRRRAGQRHRPEPERDYIDRLLKRF